MIERVVPGSPNRPIPVFMISKPIPRRSAFTLLEVALVTAIIFLLILALIPAFRGKRAEKRYPVLPMVTPVPGKAASTPVIPFFGLSTPAPAPVPPLPIDPAVPLTPPQPGDSPSNPAPAPPQNLQ